MTAVQAALVATVKVGPEKAVQETGVGVEQAARAMVARGWVASDSADAGWEVRVVPETAVQAGTGWEE